LRRDKEDLGDKGDTTEKENKSIRVGMSKNSPYISSLGISKDSFYYRKLVPLFREVHRFLRYVNSSGNK
jgi:hypothetical protein